MFELTNELNRLDEIEEQLTQQMQESLDKVSAPVKSLAQLDRLTHRYQHLVYARMVKEREKKILLQKHQQQIGTLSSDTRKMDIKPKKANKSGARVTFDVPPDLGIPYKYPSIDYQQNYAIAYYDDTQEYYEYDYYEYDPEEEEMCEPLIGPIMNKM